MSLPESDQPMGRPARPVAAPRRRPGGRSSRVQSAVAAATLDVLAESGPAGLTVAEVAARAGVNPATIFRRWGTREGLIAGVLTRHAADAIPVPDTGSLRSDLEAFALALARFLTSPVGSALAQTPTGALSAELAAERRAMLGRQAERASVMLDRAAKRGEIAGQADPTVAVAALFGPLLLRSTIGVPIDEATAREAARFVARALLAPPDAA